MPFCNNGETELYYEIHGEGPPVLFISGLAGGSWSWYGQIPFFKHHYECVIFDNRGAGLSGKPRGLYSINQFANDALTVLDCLGIAKAHIFSVSMGGMIALEMAKIASDRVGAMVLASTHAGGKTRISPSIETIEILLNNSGLSRQEILWKNTPLYFSEKNRMKNWEVIEEYHRVQLGIPKQPEYALMGQYMAIRQFDCSSQLKDIFNPALIITGTEDIIIPPGNARLLAAGLPNAELIEVPEVGHAIYAECRDFLNEVAHRFYEYHSGVVAV